MKIKNIFIAFVAATVLLTGCSKSNTSSSLKARIGRDMNELYDPKHGAPQPIDWAMIPGGGVSDISAAKKYCIIIDTQWKDIDAIAAFVCSETSDILFMLAAYEGNKDTVYHIDTDGYTPYLELSRKSKEEQFRLYLEITRGSRKDLFVAELPSIAGLTKQQLPLSKVESIPIWKNTRSATRSDFSSAMGIPAVARIQGNEKTLYTYHIR